MCRAFSNSTRRDKDKRTERNNVPTSPTSPYYSWDVGRGGRSTEWIAESTVCSKARKEGLK